MMLPNQTNDTFFMEVVLMNAMLDDFFLFRSETNGAPRTKTPMCDELISLQDAFLQTLSKKQQALFEQLEPLWLSFMAQKEKAAYKDGFCDGVALIKEALHGNA